MWISKDATYIARVHRLIGAMVHAVRLDAPQLAAELYAADDSGPPTTRDGGAERVRRRSPITQHAKHLVNNLGTLGGLLATLSIVLTYGKKASIATQMQRHYDAAQGKDRDGVCDQLLDAMCIGRETAQAQAFKKSMPPTLRVPMSMDDFEVCMNRALLKLTTGRGAGTGAGDAEEVPLGGAGAISAGTCGIIFTLTHLFRGEAERVVGGGDATMCEAGGPGLEVVDPKVLLHQRWVVRQLLESVMQDAHPRLSFVMGPCLRSFSHLRGVPHRILDIW